jgi:hypothetical protein
LEISGVLQDLGIAAETPEEAQQVLDLVAKLASYALGYDVTVSDVDRLVSAFLTEKLANFQSQTTH